MKIEMEKKMKLDFNSYHLHGKTLAKFSNFGLIFKLSPKELCLAWFLGLAEEEGKIQTD